MPMRKDEIEAARAAAIEAGKRGGGIAGPRSSAPGLPNQSRFTLARAAIRPNMRGRVMLSGPAGAGKTYTALVIAATLVGPAGRILVIDTEKESSLTYADVFDFDQLPWNPPYDPTALSLTLKEAAGSYDCCIVDSFSHYWRKQGGVLDIAGDNVRGWKSARPIQENLIETLLDVDMHVIVCCRSKMDHLLEERAGGKIAVTKVGLKAQQDDDLEYEVNVALEIDMQHVLHIAKSRTNAVPVGAQFLAGLSGDFAQQYREWLASGEAVASKADTDALRAAFDQITDLGEQSKAKMEFLDTFGRPEFLLVSRLPDARAWIADAIAGRSPVERGEDDEPPEPSGTDGPSAPQEASGPIPQNGQTAPETATHAEPGPTPAGNGHTDLASDEEIREGETSRARQAAIDGVGDPEDGDTGHCEGCGAPIWFAVTLPGQPDEWRHADPETDDEPCPIVEPRPAGPDVDVDALYAAAHPPAPRADLAEATQEAATAATVRSVEEAQVKTLTLTEVIAELKDRKEPLNGTPPQLRVRLIEARLRAAAQPTT